MEQLDLFSKVVEKTKTHLVMPKVPGTEIEIPGDYEGEPVTAEEGEFFSNNGCSPFDKCKGCDELLIDIYRDGEDGRYHIEEGYYSDKVDGFVCGACREGDADPGKGIVTLFKPSEKSVTKYYVGHYSDELWSGPYPVEDDELDDLRFEPEGTDDEGCPIDFTYHSMDGWRGYYVPILPEGWLNVHADSVLAMSEDADELEMFNRDIKKALWNAGMEYAVLLETTSNLFSTGYDVVAKCTPDELKMVGILSQVQALELKYRDRGRFMRTALTGSGEDSKEGNLTVKAYDMIRAGASAQEVIKKLASEVGK